jgi:hypothetical protein
MSEEIIGLKKAVYSLYKKVEESLLYEKQKDEELKTYIADLIAIEIRKLSIQLDKEFKLLATGQAFEYGLSCQEFEKFKQEYLKRYEEEGLRYQKQLHEYKINALKSIQEASEAIKMFYEDPTIKKVMAKEEMRDVLMSQKETDEDILRKNQQIINEKF